MTIRCLIAGMIALLPLSAIAQVEVQEVTSPGGVEAWLVEDDTIPFVAIEFVFIGGAYLDPPDKQGAANFVSWMLEEGSGDMDGQAFAAAQEALAADFGYSDGDEIFTVSLKTLTENRDASVALLHQAITEPSFPEDAFDRVKELVLSSIREDTVDPNTLAWQEFYAQAFGDHPAARWRIGTLETIEPMTPQDLRDAHARLFSRNQVIVGAAGDITAEELGDLIDTFLDGLPERDEAMPAPAEYQLTGGVTVVPFDSPQSEVVFGHAGIPWDDPDYMVAFVLNDIMASRGFGTRLTRALREESGLTYSVGAGLSGRTTEALYAGSLSTDNDTAAEAIEVLREIWAETAAGTITAEELDVSKTYLTGAYPLRFSGNEAIAGILASMQWNGFAADYIANRNDLVRAITLEEVNAMARRLLDPEGLRIVVVGQPEGVESTD